MNLVFLPFIVFAIPLFIILYTKMDTKLKKTTLMLAFIYFPILHFYHSYLMKQSIDDQANKKLLKYLKDFQTISIEKPYGARKIRLFELKKQKNKEYITNLYLRYFNDDYRIDYNELYNIGIKTSNRNRYEK